jgi:hypothetical protein
MTLGYTREDNVSFFEQNLTQAAADDRPRQLGFHGVILSRYGVSADPAAASRIGGS